MTRVGYYRILIEAPNILQRIKRCINNNNTYLHLHHHISEANHLRLVTVVERRRNLRPSLAHSASLALGFRNIDLRLFGLACIGAYASRIDRGADEYDDSTYTLISLSD